MGYQVYKKTHTNGSVSWSLYEESWDKEKGKSVKTCIKQKYYHTLGFNTEWTVEQARERKNQLNKESELTRKKLLAAKRITEENLVHDVYLPDFLVTKFTEHLFNLTAPKRTKTIKQHWIAVKNILFELKLKPEALGKYSDKIFLEFEKRKYSKDYSNKLVRVMNLWGQYVSDEVDVTYRPIKLSSYQKERLEEAQSEKDDVRRRALPFTPKSLKIVKMKFKDRDLEKQWKWLWCSLWLGLRPKELDTLIESKKLTIRTDAESNIQYLEVLQTKLKYASTSNKKKIKSIPICTKEQKEALSFIKKKECKRPLTKSIHSIIGEGYDTYSGRQGFSDLMIQQGWAIEDVAQMLGHSKLDTLFKHYKDKSKFVVPKKFLKAA